MARPKPVPERNATGETDRVYHEIKQTLRVSGVTLNFRTLAGYKNVLPLLWDELQPNLETRDFEDGADRIRARAVQLAAALASPHPQPLVILGESQRYQIQSALKLYHYIDPKILLLTSALRVSLQGESIGWDDVSAKVPSVIVRGVPARMYPMEIASDTPDDIRLHRVFEDIKRTLTLPAVNSEYRTLALWPEYLISAWERLKPIVKSPVFQAEADEIRQLSVLLARNLPYPIHLSLRRIEAAGEDPEQILRTIERFEFLLPSLILNNCALLFDWLDEAQLKESPFPATLQRKSITPEARAV